MADGNGLPGLIRELREYLGFRRLEAGRRRLDAALPDIMALPPGTPGLGVATGLLAQWVDAGYGCPDLVRQALNRFPAAERGRLALADFVHVRTAEGFLAINGEDLELARRHLALAQSLEGDLDDLELLAVSNFWVARCLRKEGRYEDALAFIARGKALALAAGYGPMAAVMQVAEAWVSFQKGRLNEAASILRRAEEALRDTDDYITRGNIHSAYGRIARRRGRYDEALHCFERGIQDFRRLGREEMHLARSLSNMAFVKRLLALELQQKLDTDSARRRSGTGAADPRVRETRAEIEQIRKRALAQLQEAEGIYRRAGSQRGLAGVHVNLGFLRLDSGDVEGAASEAAGAFDNALGKHDYIGMARARILQCIVECTRVEEQIGDPARDAAHAEEYAREAVEFAEHTQNRRLLARACVWQGLAFTCSPVRRQDAAQRALDRAIALLKPDGQEMEYSWHELDELKARLRAAAPIEPLLREWSAGLVGDRTFQQISEQFAAILIPKVWEREGRKVSRVAARLSISPKKVRRVLQNAGLLGRSAAAAE